MKNPLLNVMNHSAQFETNFRGSFPRQIFETINTVLAEPFVLVITCLEGNLREIARVYF